MMLVPQENGWGAHADSRPAAAPLVVDVCGRSVYAFAGVTPSLDTLQAALQRETSLTGQIFEVLDEHGSSLATDGDLRAVVERGGKLTANLSEASVHYIENRREELSQLQWKVLRDKVSSVSEKIVQVGHKLHELSEDVTTFKHEHEESCRRMRAETQTLIERSKDAYKRDFHQLGERVDAVSNSITSERSRREMSKQSIEQQIQGLRDMLSADRSTRRTELGGTNSMLEEGRLALLEEAKKKEVLEARHTTDVNWLSERIEAVAQAQGEQVQDLCEQLKTVALNVNASLQDGTRSVLQVQSIAESTQIEASSRMKVLEDRIYGYESRIGEIANREVLHYDDLLAKHRKTYAILEDLRLEERGLTKTGMSMRRLQSEELEETRKSLPQSPIMSTTMLSEVEAPGLHAAASVTAPGMGSFGPTPQQSAWESSAGASVAGPSRGSIARSVSPPMSLRSSSHAAAQSANSSATAPGMVGSFSAVPGSVPVAFRQASGSTTRSFTAAPRSVSPTPVGRFASYAGGSSPTVAGIPVAGIPVTAPWNMQQQQRQMSVPRQRPDGIATCRSNGTWSSG